MATIEEHETKYPEHVKLRAIVEHSQRLGMFLDWLADHEGAFLCKYEKGDIRRYNTGSSHQKVLGLYFGIDPDKIEAEKREMLDDIAEASAAISVLRAAELKEDLDA